VLEVERRRPGTFSGLFLYEPVIFPVPSGIGPDRRILDNHMALGASKRRPAFASWEEAAANFSVKGPFAISDPDLVASYVYWGFNEQPDGSVRLKCEPTDEAELFTYSVTDLFEHVESISAPVTLAVSEHTNDTFSLNGPIIAARLPQGRLLNLPGRSHFGMFERIPDMTELIVTSLLGG